LINNIRQVTLPLAGVKSCLSEDSLVLFGFPGSRLGPPECSRVELTIFARENRIVNRLWLATGKESRNVTQQPEQRVRRGWVEVISDDIFSISHLTRLVSIAALLRRYSPSLPQVAQALSSRAQLRSCSCFRWPIVRPLPFGSAESCQLYTNILLPY